MNHRENSKDKNSLRLWGAVSMGTGDNEKTARHAAAKNQASATPGLTMWQGRAPDEKASERILLDMIRR